MNHNDFTNYNYLFFDLDGTLTDPALGLTNSIIYALEKFGINVAKRSDLYCFIGPPLIDSFINYYGFSEQDAKIAVSYFREYFSDKGLFENHVYPGIKESLSALSQSDKKLVVATSKPEHFAKTILDHFDLAKYFLFIAGSTLDETRTKKAEVIKYAISELEIEEVRKVLMIGDREHDILGAKECGMDSAGVLYGYGSLDELNKAGANYIFKDPSELTKLIQ